MPFVTERNKNQKVCSRYHCLAGATLSSEKIIRLSPQSRKSLIQAPGLQCSRFSVTSIGWGGRDHSTGKRESHNIYKTIIDKSLRSRNALGQTQMDLLSSTECGH